MNEILIHTDKGGKVNVYDISTYEKMQIVFGGIIAAQGGDASKIIGMKKLSEFTNILEYEYGLTIGADYPYDFKTMEKNWGYITTLQKTYKGIFNI